MINGTIAINDMSKVNKFDQHLPFPMLLLIHNQNRTRIKMIQSLNLKPLLQLQQPLQNLTVNLRRENAIRVSSVDVSRVGRNKLVENQGDTLSREVLQKLPGRFPGRDGIFDAGDSET